MINILHIGTRGSKLALIQAETVRGLLAEIGVESELVIIKTSGDSFTDKPFREAGIGAFVREIDERMLAGEIDVAVHSLKDVPSKRPREIGMCAVLPRASPYDVLVFDRTPRADAVVGTSSLRRQAQLARYYPLFNCKQIRGNVDTRVRKLLSGEIDAVLLAEAGLERLGIRINRKRMPFIPSPNQGIIAVMADTGIAQYESIAQLNDQRTHIEGAAERIIMETLGGGCLVPLGVFAQLNGESLSITAEVLSLDGERSVRLTNSFPSQEYARAAYQFANQINTSGGEELIAEAITKGLGDASST